MSSQLSPEQIVQGQLDAYNAQDLDVFCQFFTNDVFVAGYMGDVICQGIEAFRQRHVGIFGDFPKNKAVLLSRVVLGETIFDHEEVSRGDGSPKFFVGCIYTITNARISRIEYIKAG